MEYSLEEARKLTKQSLLSNNSVFELYEAVYDNIFKTAKQGETSITFSINDDEAGEYSLYKDVMSILNMDGFVVVEDMFENDIIFIVIWENIYDIPNHQTNCF